MIVAADNWHAIEMFCQFLQVSLYTRTLEYDRDSIYWDNFNLPSNFCPTNHREF